MGVSVCTLPPTDETRIEYSWKAFITPDLDYNHFQPEIVPIRKKIRQFLIMYLRDGRSTVQRGFRLYPKRP